MSKVIVGVGLIFGWVAWGCDSGAARNDAGADTVEDTASATDTRGAESDSAEVGDEDAVVGDARDVADGEAADVADVGEVMGDACAGVSCAVPPDRCNGDRSGVVTSADAMCVADGDGFACQASEATTACAVGTAFCAETRCMTHEEFCRQDPKRRWTYYTKLAAGDQSDPRPDGSIADRCCFDFDGDGEIDNRLGQVFWQNRALLGNMNEVAAKNIRDGLLKMLVEVRGLPDPEGEPVDPDAPLNAERIEIIGAGGSGAQGGQDPATGLAVSGLLANMTWFPTTHLPRSFGIGKIVDGRLLSEDGQSVLRTGGTLPGLQIPIMFARFDARVAIGPNGRGLTMGGLPGEPGGKFGGLVPVRGFYDLVNAVVTEQCACAQFGPGVLPVDLETGECNAPIEGDCSAAASFCQALTGPLCSAFMGLFEPDMDSDGDGQRDSLSVGFWYEGTSIAFSGCALPNN